ncbi:MAG: hypothetical protein DMG36_15385, partial [Acidobacteria bacterium]
MLEHTEPKNRTDKIWRAPRAMFVVDTETRTDSTQRLTFGSYRFFVDDELQEEGLFYADDLSKRERKTLEGYVDRWNKRASKTSEIPLLLLTRREFLK